MRSDGAAHECPPLAESVTALRPRRVSAIPLRGPWAASRPRFFSFRASLGDGRGGLERAGRCRPANGRLAHAVRAGQISQAYQDEPGKHASQPDHARFHRRLGERLDYIGSADARQRLLAPAARSPGPGDRDQRMELSA
jgi:hypothetical protein